MPVDIYIAPSESTSPRWGRAFADGCGSHSIYTDDKLRERPVAMFGSTHNWNVLKAAQAAGREWYYGDHAFFGRFKFYRCARNRYQHDGIGDAKPGRFLAHGIKIEPWRKTGGHVLICPPDDKFAALMEFNASDWLTRTRAQIAANSDRPIRVRSRTAIVTPLAADLADCWVLVTYMSNAAVEAVLAGIPVICTGPCAARTMGLTDPCQVEQPIRSPLGRLRWAANLAANQWTLAEMAAGMCWREVSR